MVWTSGRLVNHIDIEGNMELCAVLTQGGHKVV